MPTRYRVAVVRKDDYAIHEDYVYVADSPPSVDDEIDVEREDGPAERLRMRVARLDGDDVPRVFGNEI